MLRAQCPPRGSCSPPSALPDLAPRLPSAGGGSPAHSLPYRGHTCALAAAEREREAGTEARAQTAKETRRKGRRGGGLAEEEEEGVGGVGDAHR
ncbi:hypothetical protein NDU88_004933 [Pleurodeles waltl]|uniref:Uncharacterized protein n=1 Tax=Pleurodeles waltl TaxID=8319 RepID=A0AAV7VIE5_PLEWA|nr:hypothetical protein NDU88_004933 [Pleurodeles waltl]